MDELVLLEWDQNQMEKGRFIENENNENHCCDAALCVERSTALPPQEQTPKPEFGSQDYFEALEREMESDMIAKVKRMEEDEELEWWEVN